LTDPQLLSIAPIRCTSDWLKNRPATRRVIHRPSRCSVNLPQLSRTLSPTIIAP